MSCSFFRRFASFSGIFLSGYLVGKTLEKILSSAKKKEFSYENNSVGSDFAKDSLLSDALGFGHDVAFSVCGHLITDGFFPVANDFSLNVSPVRLKEIAERIQGEFSGSCHYFDAEAARFLSVIFSYVFYVFSSGDNSRIAAFGRYIERNDRYDIFSIDAVLRFLSYLYFDLDDFQIPDVLMGFELVPDDGLSSVAAARFNEGLYHFIEMSSRQRDSVVATAGVFLRRYFLEYLRSLGVSEDSETYSYFESRFFSGDPGSRTPF